MTASKVDTEFYRQFLYKRKLRKFYKKNYRVLFTQKEFDILTVKQFIKLGEERKFKLAALRRENKAATVIQKAIRNFLARKRYNEYIIKYRETQKR